jgi:hypothetical protein
MKHSSSWHDGYHARMYPQTAKPDDGSADYRLGYEQAEADIEAAREKIHGLHLRTDLLLDGTLDVFIVEDRKPVARLGRMENGKFIPTPVKTGEEAESFFRRWKATRK